MSITTPNYFSLPYPSFQPAMRNILSITQSFPATITTTFDGTNPGDHQYITGLVCRLRIPYGWGMEQADQFESPITVTSPTTFTMPIDTTMFAPFVVPTGQPTSFATPAVVVNVGEINTLLVGAQQNVLPYPLGPLNPVN